MNEIVLPLALAGKRPVEIAEALGIAHKQARNAVCRSRAAGHQLPKISSAVPGRVSAYKEPVRELLVQGFPNRETAKRLGITASHVGVIKFGMKPQG